MPLEKPLPSNTRKIANRANKYLVGVGFLAVLLAALYLWFGPDEGKMQVVMEAMSILGICAMSMGGVNVVGSYSRKRWGA